VVGTTDTAIEAPVLEPRAREEEIRFLLETAGQYLEEDPDLDDVKAIFTGIRPLVRATEGVNTAQLSRDHTLHVGPSGLLTICGGKWTTYRKMAEDCVDHAIHLGGLEERPCITRGLNVHGYHPNAARFGGLAGYGSDAPALQALIREEPVLGERLHPRHAVVGAQVVWAAREEMARTVDDVLARRTRVLQLDARAALAMAPAVATLLARELGRDAEWEREELARFEVIVGSHLPG
jgi:glycerol-3-phosphate dehydrogenase